MKLQITTIAAVLLVGCGPSEEDRALIVAAFSGNIEAVKQHIANGADVNAKDKDGDTPLNSAAFSGHKEIAELLIAKGADVNAKGGVSGGTPLHSAAFSGHKEVAEQLISKGADVNAKLKGGETPLDLASLHPEIADLLRKHGGKTGVWFKAEESIHIAAMAGHIEAVKKHLADGTDVNVKDENGWTPLNSAAVKGRNQIVKLLIEKGADLNSGTPLIAAATDGHMEVIELLIANGADVNAKANDQLGGTALHMTANLGHKKIVELLVAAGADVNAKMLHGMTPLHFAANNKGIAKFLIDKGADVNAKLNDGPQNGFTPLDFANVPNLGDPEIADLLRKHGGKTGEELKGGEPVAEAATPEPSTAKARDISILEAATIGDIDAVKQSLAGGADVNAREKWGVTPLHWAANWGHKEIAEILIAAGADVNAKDHNDYTPLDFANHLKRTEIADLIRKHGGKTGEELNVIIAAAKKGDIEAVKQHLATGADVNEKNMWGVTPLHWAARKGYKEVVELLIAKGADLNAKTKNGNTALDLAIQYNQSETADLLRKHGGKTAEELKAEGAK
jgi:ankyrin repeat protein